MSISRKLRKTLATDAVAGARFTIRTAADYLWVAVGVTQDGSLEKLAIGWSHDSVLRRGRAAYRSAISRYQSYAVTGLYEQTAPVIGEYFARFPRRSRPGSGDLPLIIRIFTPEGQWVPLNWPVTATPANLRRVLGTSPRPAALMIGGEGHQADFQASEILASLRTGD